MLFVNHETPTLLWNQKKKKGEREREELCVFHVSIANCCVLSAQKTMYRLLAELVEFQNALFRQNPETVFMVEDKKDQDNQSAKELSVDLDRQIS